LALLLVLNRPIGSFHLLQSGSRLIRIKAQNEQHQPVFGKFLSQDPDSQIYNV